MVRRSLIPALVLLTLALGASDAYADPFTISYEPSNPVVGQTVTFTAARDKGNDDSDVIWNFGEGDDVATTGTVQPTHIYDTPGTYTVTLREPDSADPPAEVTVTVAPASDPPPPANAPPSAVFSFAPVSPLVGQSVSFTGGTDPDGDSLTWFWNFDDGATSAVPAPTHEYSTAGAYNVALTVTDSRGAFDTRNQTVTVTSPDDPVPPGDGPPPFNDPGPSAPVVGGSDPIFPTQPTAPTLMRPFPVVRIAGVVLPRGALVRILSVRGPRGMQVRVRCRGRGCPVASMRVTSATRLARLRRFERRLSAGTTLEVFVRKPGKIGKYTRFAIRAGEAPARVDRCLVPGRVRPVRCQ